MRYRRRTYRTNRRGQKVYMYKRMTGVFGTLTVNNVTPTFFGYNFSLSDLPNPTEFTNLYDVYKINAVKMVFIPQQTENISLSTVNNAAANARFFSAIDYTDSTGPSSIDDLRQYQSCKYTPILRPHKRYLKPRIMDSGANYNPGRPWLACSSPNVNYFGVYIGVEPISSSVAATMAYSIECTYYVSFKNVK